MTMTGVWDVWMDGQLVSTLDELKTYCAGLGITVDDFCGYAVADLMPPEMKAEAQLECQERVAQLLVDTQGLDTSDGVLGVLEKGVFSWLRRVRSPEGREKYDQEIGSVIRPDVNLPGKRKKGKTGKAGKGQVDAGAKTEPADTRHRGIREGWGGAGHRAGESAFEDVARKKPKSKRPTTGKWAERKELQNQSYFGTWTPQEYADGLKAGAFDGWSSLYKAAWIDDNGKIHALEAHEYLPGYGTKAPMTIKDAETAGWIRTQVMSHDLSDGMTPLTNPMVTLQFTRQPTSAQLEAITALSGEFDSEFSMATLTLNSQHAKDWLEAGEGQEYRKAGETLNQDYDFDTLAELMAFLANPATVPTKYRKARRTDERSGPSYGEMQRMLRGEVDPERKGGDGNDEVETKLIRRVRTPGGMDLYDQPIGSVIRPDVTPGGVIGIVRRVSVNLKPNELAALDKIHPSARERLETTLRHRRMIEPEVTTVLEKVVGDYDGEMLGLDFKFKTPAKILSKVDRYVERGMTPEEAVDTLADTLRYTASLPPARYADGVRTIIDELGGHGFQFIGVENFWESGDTYNGINAVLLHVATGFQIELQFHTPESFYVKSTLNHADYDRYTKGEGTPEERKEMFIRMRDNADSVEFPARDVLGIGTLVFRPFEE